MFIRNGHSNCSVFHSKMLWRSLYWESRTYLGWDDQTQMLSENYIFSAFICLLQSVLHAKNIFLCRPGEISNRIEGYIHRMVFLKCVKGILVVISPDFAIWHYICLKASQFNSSLISATLLAWKCMGERPKSIHQDLGAELGGSKWKWDSAGDNSSSLLFVSWDRKVAPSQATAAFLPKVHLFSTAHLLSPQRLSLLCALYHQVRHTSL